MSFANFGLGLQSALGAYSQAQGIKDDYTQRKNKKEILGLTQQGLTDSAAQRDADIAASIKPAAAPDGSAGYQVGDSVYGDQQSAQKAADKSAASVMDYFNKTVAPKISQQYVAQGDMGKAEQWNSYIQNAQTQRGLKSFSSALKAHVMGDDEGAIKHMVDAYNNEGYFNDGEKASTEPLKDADGNVIGHALTITDATGKKHTQNVKLGDLSAIVQMGIADLSPEKAFEVSAGQTAAADKVKAETAGKRAEAADKFGYDLELQKRRIQGEGDNKLLGLGMEGTATAAKRTAELKAEEAYLRNLGLPDAEIRDTMKKRVSGNSGTVVNIGDKAYEIASKTPGFGYLPPEKQKEIINQTRQQMQEARDAGAPVPTAPERGTIAPAPQDAQVPLRQPATMGLTIYDPATGQYIQQ